MMHSKANSNPARSAEQSMKERVATPAEHRMKRIHEARTKDMAQSMADALNAAMRSGKTVR